VAQEPEDSSFRHLIIAAIASQLAWSRALRGTLVTLPRRQRLLVSSGGLFSIIPQAVEAALILPTPLC